METLFWGVASGFRQHYLSSEKFSSYVSLDYALSFYKMYNPYDYFPEKSRNTVQELLLNLGMEYHFIPKFSGHISFGYGIYRESYHTIQDPSATTHFHGLAVNAKLGLKYKLFAF